MNSGDTDLTKCWHLYWNLVSTTAWICLVFLTYCLQWFRVILDNVRLWKTVAFPTFRFTHLLCAWYCRIGMQWEREREMFYLTTHSTHFIYGYMASDIWLRTILIVRKETRCHHVGYSYRLTARVLLYAASHRQDNTYHSLCYTSRGSLAAESNEWMFNDTSAQNINRLLGVRQMVC